MYGEPCIEQKKQAMFVDKDRRTKQWKTLNIMIISHKCKAI